MKEVLENKKLLLKMKTAESVNLFSLFMYTVYSLHTFIIRLLTYFDSELMYSPFYLVLCESV
jgi:hypothetical protein